MHHHELSMSGSGEHGLLAWFSGYGYAPHSGCFLGDNRWVAGYVAANWFIALAYALISLLIRQRMARASHIPKTVMGMSMLGIFVTCAGGHFLAGITTVIWPGYRFETLWHWLTVIPAYLFLANHNRFSLIVEGPHTIAETREELSQKNAELNAAYLRIKQLDELKSAFFANVSHELRTPLTLIMTPVGRLLKAQNITETQRRDLEVVDRNARALLKQVNDLLDLSKLEADRMELYYSKTDLAAMVRVTAANFDVVVEEKALTFTLETPEALPAEADTEKIERVVLNLLSNAFKFTPDGGSVRCALADDERTATLTVQDNGPGIPPDMRESIFERFRQVESGAARSFGGTGLGLAIVKDFVEMHGGTIQAGEAPGGGALFTMRLPLSAPPDAVVHTMPASASDEFRMRQAVEELRVFEEGGTPTEASEKPLILVVEDNPEMRRFLVETLSPRYRAETAQDGAEGAEKARALLPDLILTDIMMPKHSGDWMLRELRLFSALDDTPIVVLTAKADDDLRAQLLREGAQDYVMKPFEAEELLARVGNLIAIKRAKQSLQSELTQHFESLEMLAEEVVARKRDLQEALYEAREARHAAEESARETQERNEQLAQAIQEIHHRVKNNLQAVSALLEMQVSDTGESLPIEAVYDSLLQIKTIALVHDLLSRDQPIGDVNVGKVLHNLVKLLSTGTHSPLVTYPFRLDIADVWLPTKVATSLALIVNELVSNAVKHGIASPGETFTDAYLQIELVNTGGEIRLIVQDRGQGFRPDFDAQRDAHIGLELVQTLVASDLQGRIHFGNASEHGGGRVEIRFPERPASA